ncbi:MAG: NINE protein [Chloroflexota bacterium]|nr:NINE protein [Chloroflexota bacterium]
MAQHGVVAGEVKSRPLTILLALLLGNFGVHRFYLGNIAWGLAYLLFFWTSVPGFIAWLEALYFLTRSNEEWAQNYGGRVQQPNGAAMGCLWILALLPLLVIALLAVLSVAGLVFLGGEIESILSEIGNEI